MREKRGRVAGGAYMAAEGRYGLRVKTNTDLRR
jgi:hypothetical protein